MRINGMMINKVFDFFAQGNSSPSKEGLSIGLHAAMQNNS
jgi:hypothetical protein